MGAKFWMIRDVRSLLPCSAVEHPAVMVCLRQLTAQGLATFTAVGVDSVGRVDPVAVDDAITPSTVLVTIMHSNNEVCEDSSLVGLDVALIQAGSLCSHFLITRSYKWIVYRLGRFSQSLTSLLQ